MKWALTPHLLVPQMGAQYNHTPLLCHQLHLSSLPCLCLPRGRRYNLWVRTALIGEEIVQELPQVGLPISLKESFRKQQLSKVDLHHRFTTAISLYYTVQIST